MRAATIVPQFDNPPLPNLERDYGRPTPKQFQSNTITPNKSLMVEDDEEDGAIHPRRSDAFGLDGPAGNLPSNRDTSTTTRSGASSGRETKMLEMAQAQVAELQDRVDGLEMSVRTKDTTLRRLEEETKSSMSSASEWLEIKQDLEKKLEDAESLNQTMKEELERIHTDQASMERDLRAQLDNVKRSHGGSLELRSKHDMLQKDYQELQVKLKQQRLVTEEVRQQASGFLAEMRAMADAGGGANLEREERLQADLHKVEEEVKEWKARYARAKTQLRNMRASSLGLSIQGTYVGRYANDDAFTRQDGLVRDVHITKFQIAIDELLNIARAGEPEAVLYHMKAVVMAVRNITQDIDAAPSKPDQTNDLAQKRSRLKAKVSATANNVITASKNFASSNGISPVSLLDAAASHLTAAVVELVRTVKIRPTPVGELDDNHDTLEPLQSPRYFSVPNSTRRTSARDSLYSAVSSPTSEGSGQGTMASTGQGRTMTLRGGVGGGGDTRTNGVKPESENRAPASDLDELKVS